MGGHVIINITVDIYIFLNSAVLFITKPNPADIMIWYHRYLKLLFNKQYNKIEFIQFSQKLHHPKVLILKFSSLLFKFNLDNPVVTNWSIIATKLREASIPKSNSNN
jgi:hypothetical protein